MRSELVRRIPSYRFWMGLGLALLVVVPLGRRLFPPRTAPPSSAPAPAGAEDAVDDPIGIVFHHSESAAAYHGHRIDATRLDGIHETDHRWGREYQGKVYHIGYHYVVTPDGSWQQGRPDRCLGAHARRHNNWLGICLIGNFDTHSRRYGEWPRRPTSAQVHAVIRLCEQLMLKYAIPVERIRRHRDVNETHCPGNRFPFSDIQAELVRFDASHPEIRRRFAGRRLHGEEEALALLQSAGQDGMAELASSIFAVTASVAGPPLQEYSDDDPRPHPRRLLAHAKPFAPAPQATDSTARLLAALVRLVPDDVVLPAPAPPTLASMLREPLHLTSAEPAESAGPPGTSHLPAAPAHGRTN